MDIYEKIKSIDIKLVLDDMGVKTNNKKRLRDRYENKYTDSYTYSSKFNIVKSHNPAKEWRPYGNPLNFYIGYTGSEIKDAVEWFNTTYNLEVPINEYKHIEKMNIISDDDRLSSYLSLRGIQLSKLPKGEVSLVISKTFGKNAPIEEGYCLSIKMRDITNKITGYQYRSLVGKGFNTNGSDGIFFNFTKDLKKDTLYIVEGLSDYLSLRQYTQQVIGFKSASANPNDDIIAFINKFNNIYLLFDTDTAGKKCKELFKKDIDSNIFELDVDEDINDLCKELRSGLLEMINSGAIQTKEKTFDLIEYSEGLYKGISELRNRKKESVMSWGFQKFDDRLGFLLPGQLIVIGGITGIGKSTIVNQIANNVARQGFSVARMSLEDRLEENRINDLFYETKRIRDKLGLRMPNHSLFEANMFSDEEYEGLDHDIDLATRNLLNYNKGIIDLSHKKMVDIIELENLFRDVVINKGVSLVIIDHLHYVKFDKNQRHDLAIEDFMHSLNDLLRKYNVTCILVSHYRKLQKDEEPDNNSFKDGAAIAQVANKVIHIDKDREEIPEEEDVNRSIRYIITKNRGKSWLGILFGRYNNGRVYMDESSLSKTRREQKRLGF